MGFAYGAHIKQVPVAWRERFAREQVVGEQFERLCHAWSLGRAPFLSALYSDNGAALKRQILLGTQIQSVGVDSYLAEPSSTTQLVAYLTYAGLFRLNALLKTPFPTPMVTECGLVGSLFCWSLMLQEAAVNYSKAVGDDREKEGGKDKIPSDLDYAKGYVLAIIRLVNSDSFDALLAAIIGEYLGKDNPVMALFFTNRLKILMLSTAVATFLQAQITSMDGKMWRTVVERPDQVAQGSSDGSFIYALWINIHLHMPADEGEHNVLVETLEKHYDHEMAGDLLLQPNRILPEVFTDVQRPVTQIFA